MSEENQTGGQIGINQIFLKDCSFEAPNTPEVFFAKGERSFEQMVEISHRELPENMHEVVLTVTLTAKIGETVAWIIEINQAGVFAIEGYTGEDFQQIVQIVCPTQLYPYVRETAAGLIAKSGFPPMTLDFFSFEQMYFEQKAQQQQEA